MIPRIFLFFNLRFLEREEGREGDLFFHLFLHSLVDSFIF